MTGAWWPEATVNATEEEIEVMQAVADLRRDFQPFTLVAESDLQFSSVPNHDRPLTLRKGESVTFTSADHLYVRTLRDGAEEKP